MEIAVLWSASFGDSVPIAILGNDLGDFLYCIIAVSKAM